MKISKITIVLAVLLTFGSCAELQQVVNNLPTTGGPVTQEEIIGGLKQALEFGVVEGVNILNKEDGYFKDEAVKILLPEELQKVDATLRKIGLSNLADEGLKVLNRAAEDAVSEAKPIFVQAIKDFTFADAKTILTSSNDLAATEYLEGSTSTKLAAAFEPKIAASLDKVGANDIWATIIQKYNTVPLVKPVNPNLTEYVTNQAIDGLFVKVGDKEKEIRNSVSSRTTALLQKVFALQ
ncbi:MULTISPECIES: DUF4197 domain-containing protein [Flavobacteriaceae]|uniref:DUF4197 domain-containing protein n=1 Tax=Croceivirga radicis TaxID=1929488 RepID=A0A1V6LSZ2_9FLAO|nr:MULTISPECIES: DUF4197 domain-containing protein [Flavobacteriaceae]OQD43295.1 hypothetical protein BUL40_05515 [Croceivirga radicis]TKD65943.1 DUF4197 domain-containing protein [Flavobacterium sp. ASW18X]